MTFTSQWRCQSAAGASSSARRMMPALEQNTSTWPKRSVLAFTRCCMSASSATLTRCAKPPMAAATACALPSSRSATTTPRAPSWAKRSHSARPMPDAPPVTTTTLPLMSMALCPFQFGCVAHHAAAPAPSMPLRRRRDHDRQWRRHEHIHHAPAGHLELAAPRTVPRLVAKRQSVLCRQRHADHGCGLDDDRAHRLVVPRRAGADGRVPADVPAVAAGGRAGRHHRPRSA